MSVTTQQTVTIHRHTKLEAILAIQDLERRGYVVVSPLTNIRSDEK